VKEEWHLAEAVSGGERGKSKISNLQFPIFNAVYQTHQISREWPVRKAIVYLLYLSILLGLWSAAAAFGRRAKEPAQRTYHQAVEESLPESWTALSFLGDQPAMLATKESVQFLLRPEGQIPTSLERAPGSKIFLSEKGKFIGLQELSDPSEKPGAPRSLSFTLYDGQGQKLWTGRQSLGGDEPMPSFYLSDLGTTVLMEPLDGVMTFHQQDGSMIRGFQLFPGAMPETERPVACDFSAEGRFLAVNALRRHSMPGSELSPREKGYSYLMLFDSLGQEMWRRELEQEISHLVEISPDGQMIVAGGYSVKGLDAVERATYLYDAQGKLLHAFDFSFRQADFSADDRFLLLGQRNTLRLVQTSTGITLWENILSGEAGQIRALDLSPDGSLALVELAQGTYQGAQFVYTAPHIFLFDAQGHQVWTQDFPQDRFLQPLVKFLENGSSILVALENRYLIYEQDQ
jgi:hypothetical protein